MNESLKQALKITLGVVLVINQAVFFHLTYNLSGTSKYNVLWSGGIYIITLFSSFIWVHAKCKEERKPDYDLLFKGLSIAAPGLAIAIFDIIPQKWIIYLNAALYIASPLRYLAHLLYLKQSIRHTKRIIHQQIQLFSANNCKNIWRLQLFALIFVSTNRS